MRKLLLLYGLLLLPLQSFSQTARGVITGRLISVEGVPAAGIRVAALETAYPRMNIPSLTQTDQDGRYRLENVPPGEYFIVADHFNIPSYYPGTGNRDNATTVSVTAGSTTNNLDFRVVRDSGILRAVRTPSSGAAKFSGMLHDTRGKALPNITVTLLSNQTSARRWTVTSNSGLFEFAGLTAGQFSMETFSPEDVKSGSYEQATLSITLREGESLDQEIGLRRVGNWEQRPDLYARRPAEARGTGRGVSMNEVPFWRLMRLDQQAQPEYPQAARDANIKGSVALEVEIGQDGKIALIRAASPEANADFTRAAVEAVSKWSFPPMKITTDPFNRFVIAEGEGEPVSLQSILTFNFPANP